jgi:hypothetical protein
MSSYVRRLQKRMMRKAGMEKIQKPIITKALDGRPSITGYRKVVVDSEGVEYGENWPRAIPPAFRLPVNPTAKDRLARVAREVRKIF